MSHIVLRDVEVQGSRVDVHVSGAVIAAMGPTPPTPAHCQIIDGGGGALLPGLWDHHIHLFALAAAQTSTRAGPPQVTTIDQLASILCEAADRHPSDGWVRAVGYHESVAGSLDRHTLDRIVASRPVRIQHRSGTQWILNSAAVAALDLDRAKHPGIERDRQGHPTGRLLDADCWLRDRLGPGDPPDLSQVGRTLASFGVTGVTDATPYDGIVDLEALAGAVTTGALPQRIVVTAGPALAAASFPAHLTSGPVKIILHEHKLPNLDELVEWIRRAHLHHRPVAVHCVTRATLALALAAWDTTGAHPGDRIEHGSVIPLELLDPIAQHGLTVVTQPSFVTERGDQYLADVDPHDRAHLYRCRSLLDARIPLAAGTDAPFGDPDPWRAIASATHRRTPAGATLSAHETISAARAIELFLGPPDQPGGPPRTLKPGTPADLCLLDAPLREALNHPDSNHVAATLIHGAVAWSR